MLYITFPLIFLIVYWFLILRTNSQNIIFSSIISYFLLVITIKLIIEIGLRL
jgi:hypothetical protein